MTSAQSNSKLPPSYYEASLAQLDGSDNSRPDYPTLSHQTDCDVCIIGGGFMGLHTALNLQELGLKVVLLEAQRIGYGASGRNGGHVIPEFAGSQRNFEKQLDMQSARQVWQLAHQAADKLRERIAHYKIDCDYQAGHIEAAITSKHVAALQDWQVHVKQNYDYSYQFISQIEMPQYIGSTRYQAGLLDMNGGHLHPLKLALGLAKALKDIGGEIYEHSAATSWNSEQDAVRVQTADGEVNCKHLVLGCNVGMDAIQNNAAQKLAQRILPVASWVIATEPLTQSVASKLLPSRAAVIDMRFILDYYRLSADNRLVFGGGCSYTGQETPTGFIDTMRDKMLKVFPQLIDTKVEFGWGGLIDMSMNRMPDFGYVQSKNLLGYAESKKELGYVDDTKRILYAQGFSGSGIVATMAAARVITEAISGNTSSLAMFQRIQHTPFPGGKWLRGPITAAGMLYHRMLDLV